jgi:hypothetical protein
MVDDDAASIARVRPPERGPEREMALGMLDFQRATVLVKLAGLTDEQAFGRPVPASALSPAGLVKHLTGVEWFWFTVDFAGVPMPADWPMDDEHGPFRLAPGDTLAALVAGYRTECERSRQAIVGADFDDPARGPGMDFTLRYAVAHMIEETARHCGHLDLLRESIDGRRGE